MKKVLSFVCIALVSIVSELRAQSGSISGIISDSTSSENLIGAVVSLKENPTIAAMTDVDGSFKISNVPVGNHTLKVYYMGYKEKLISGVKVVSGQNTDVNIPIVSDMFVVDEVVVMGARLTNTEQAVIEEVKESKQVVNAISSEQISKSQDRDAGQAMRRIPGVTLIDNRFVMVRGLSERYNAVFLNGVYTPSTEVDVRSFSFNIVQSRMIDRLLVYKSGSDNLPGDFSGAAIKIYTKNVVDENSSNLGVSFSYRPNSTFSTFKFTPGSGTDFLGFDNGGRKLSESFPANVNKVSGTQLSEAGSSLPNSWTTSNVRTSPDIRLSYDISRKWYLGNKKLSSINSISYTNTNQFIQSERFRYIGYNETQQKSDVHSYFIDNQYANNVRLGLLSNWSLVLNERNNISFRNMFTQMGANETTLRTGEDRLNGFDRKDYAYRYESRGIFSSQLSGNHKLLNGKTEIDWTGGFALTSRKEPDFRRARTQRATGTNDQYVVVIPPSATTFDAGRFYSDLKEYVFANTVNLEQTIGYSSDSAKIKLRTGYYVEHKQRSFRARWMSYTRGSTNFDNNLLSLPIEQIFAPQNINNTTGFKVTEGTNPSDRYDAQNLLAAYYAGINYPFLKKFNLSTGLRMEYNRQSLQSGTYGGGVIDANYPILKLLPSANLSYNFTKKMLVRLAYFASVNRPEFRELAPFSYYDFDFNVDVKGNPELSIATIQNVDARWELYPSASEMVSFGMFYKKFTNPIERYIIPGSSNPVFTFFNAKSATSYGVEAELRKSMEFVSDYFSNFSIVLNSSLIKSTIDLGDNVTGQEQTRPMQGQSPYIINTGLFYSQEKKGLQVSLLYNVLGKRIFTVGDYLNPTIYEMPRGLLDLTVSKDLSKHFKFNFGIQDILNRSFRLVQDSDQNNKINSIDESILKFKRGSYYTAGLSYSF